MTTESQSAQRSGTEESLARAEALGNPLHPEHPLYLADGMVSLVQSLFEKLTSGEEQDLDKLKHTSFTLIGYCQKFNTWCDTMAWGQQQRNTGNGNK